MVKKISTKKAKINKLWFAFILLALIQMTTLLYTIRLTTNQRVDSSSSLARFINESESSRYAEPVIDISENRVYIPELHIFVPLTDVSRKMQYSTSTGSNMNLYLSIIGVIGSQRAGDDPTCDKMIRISVAKDASTGEKYIGEITPTQDGLRYIYQNNRKCSIYPVDASDKLADIARLIQKY